MKILTIKQLDIVVKMMEAKLRWCGFNKRIKEKREYREREIPKKTWMECEREDLHIKVPMQRIFRLIFYCFSKKYCWSDEE
jgi:hypothetical protein